MKRPHRKAVRAVDFRKVMSWLERNGVQMYYAAEWPTGPADEQHTDGGFFDLSSDEAVKWFKDGTPPREGICK